MPQLVWKKNMALWKDWEPIDFIASACLGPTRLAHRQGLISWVIKKADLIAAQPSGRGISTLTTNWAVSRRVWTGNCCLMISCSIAVWKWLMFGGMRGEIYLIWFFLLYPSWNLQLCRLVLSIIACCILQIQQQECQETTSSGCAKSKFTIQIVLCGFLQMQWQFSSTWGSSVA